MGATSIHLVGIDFRYDLDKSHFFGDGRPEGCKPPARLTETFRIYRYLYETLRKRGIDLVNESPYDGPLDVILPRKVCPWLMKKQ